MDRKEKIIYWSVLLVGLCSGFYAKQIFQGGEAKKTNNGQQVRTQGHNKYRFINPLLECETGDTLQNKSLLSFKERVSEYINESTDNGQINHASIYFRDLNNGPWFGFNEQETFSPASLSKVPLMITYFKKREVNPNLFNQVLKYEQPFEISLFPLVPPSKKIEVGHSYTIEELLKRMIVYSDNEAASLLLANVDEKFATQVFSDLGVNSNPALGGDYAMTAKTYASFFRVLFNASYLDRKDSEQALEMLSQVEFHDGLAAGVPAEIVVAHKFGERSFFSPQGSIAQLHDCGIIYYPDHPYLLCVMTRGKNMEQLKRVIQNISRFIYEDMKKAYMN